MFNALKQDELLRGVGTVLRLLAATSGPLKEYERSQALSAYSVTRLLAAEQAAAPALFADTREALLTVLDATDPLGQVSSRAREAIVAAQAGTELGDAVCDLLAGIAPDSPIRLGVHAVMADMVDREVAALAAAGR